jgi:hypothetical protein
VAEVQGSHARARSDIDDPVVLVDDIDQFATSQLVVPQFATSRHVVCKWVSTVKFLVRGKRPTMRA